MILFQTPETLVKEIYKNDLSDLINLTTKQSFFTFNNKFYIQVNGVAMGYPLGVILANIFLSHHEENWLNKRPIEFNHVLIEHMLMMFLYFLNHLNLPTRFANRCLLKTRT